MLNAALYPKGARDRAPGPDAGHAPRRPRGGRDQARRGPDRRGQAADGAAARPVKAGSTADRDVRIKVKRADGAKLKAAVKAANLSKSLKRKLQVHDDQDHRDAGRSRASARPTSTPARRGCRASRKRLDRRKVMPLYALV